MSLLPSENRQMYSGFCLHFSATSFWWWEENVSHESASDSVEITQDVSQWYRECQSCRKKSPLQLLWSAEHDLCGRLGFIHTKSTAWKLLLESDSSGLEKGIMDKQATKKINRQQFLGTCYIGQKTGSLTLPEGPPVFINRPVSQFTKTLALRLFLNYKVFRL